ncbi:MAG: SGNH/GDSL hydrolase family protein [Vicinamibacteria bacterium]|jgi:lysophospholipase L1-like esterase|nr:SGNH/GDSL hydrolase family protein [Vicinamibacteria bacterium]
MRHRRELLLAAGATLVVPLLLVAAEGAARAVSPSPCPQADAGELMGCLHVYSPDYGWALRPGIRLCPAAGCVSVNADANRGPRLPRERTTGGSRQAEPAARAPGGSVANGRSSAPEPPSGSSPGVNPAARPGNPSNGPRRVLVLGDSVAFGMDVADGLSWPERLARPGLEVVSLAVPGFGTDQELLRLEREGLAYRPDVIIVGFCLANDLVDNALDSFLYSRAHPKPRFELAGDGLRLRTEAIELPAGRRLGTWLRERSVLYNALFRGAPVQTASEQEEHWQTTSNALLARPGPLIELATRLLLRIGARGGEVGASLLVVTHPTRRSYQDGAPGWERALRERWQREGLRSVWLAETYQAQGLAWRDFAVDGTGHLNARGHALTAERVAEALAAP